MIIIYILLFILFLIWSYLMENNKLQNLDNSFYDKIKITNKKTTIFKFITLLADAKFIAFLCFISLFIIENKKIAFTIIINLLIMWFLIGILKNIFKRARPNKNRLVEEIGYSYPSGHTMTSTIFYGYVMFLILLTSIILSIKIVIIILLLIIILLIGYSRIYLGVHYLSDVIGAILFGSSYVLLYIFFTHYIFNFI